MDTYTQALLNTPSKELQSLHKNAVKTYFTCIPKMKGFWDPKVDSWHCIQGKWEKMGTNTSKTIEVCHWADPHKYHPNHHFYNTKPWEKKTDGTPYTGAHLFGLSELTQTEPK